MKKLKLKLEGVKTVLGKDELKKIAGGYSNCCLCQPYGSSGYVTVPMYGNPTCNQACQSQGYANNDPSYPYGFAC